MFFISKFFLRLLFVIFICAFSENLYPQGCCSGGSGSPIAGGSSQGVLLEHQFEISSSFQYLNSNRFKTEDRDTVKLFDNYNSRYLYSRIGYGITKKFTFSAEVGYFFNKTQIALNNVDTISSSGISDLILFPRYNVFYKSTERAKWEITLGLGLKIPLGIHNDSTHVFTNPYTGQQYFTTSPPLVQPTNGSQDFIFYGFFLRGFPKYNFQIFANTLYIKKGYNSLGQHFGDYASFGLFLSKKIAKGCVFNLQTRADLVQKMKSDKNIDLLAMYNIDVKSTGNRKIALIPQINYTYKSITVFALSEFPLYEYVNGAQVASKTLFTAGFAYRFYPSKKLSCAVPDSTFKYVCPMNCEGSGSNEPGKCPVCKMELQKVK